jgi:hypothetical protein
MGAAGHALFASVLQRVRRTLESDFGVARLYSAGSLLTRIWADERVPRDQIARRLADRVDDPVEDAEPVREEVVVADAFLSFGGGCPGGDTTRGDQLEEKAYISGHLPPEHV